MEYKSGNSLADDWNFGLDPKGTILGGHLMVATSEKLATCSHLGNFQKGKKEKKTRKEKGLFHTAATHS